MLDTGEEDALALLSPHIHEKFIRAAIDLATEACPGWMFQRSLELLSTHEEPALRTRVIKAIEVQGLDQTRVWAEMLGGGAASFYGSLVAAEDAPTAEIEDLPPFFATRHGAPKRRPPTTSSFR